jgi:hypothetical protein
MTHSETGNPYGISPEAIEESMRRARRFRARFMVRVIRRVVRRLAGGGSLPATGPLRPAAQRV